MIADVGDNPGGGGLGDDMSLLPVLAALGRPFGFGFVFAPALSLAAAAAGIGGNVEMPTPAGPLRARVERISAIAYRNAGPMMQGDRLDGGPGAVLSLGRSRVLIASRRVQAYDINAFHALGVAPEAIDIIAIKSSAHFRASYACLATGGIVLVDTGGLSSPRRTPPALHPAQTMN